LRILFHWQHIPLARPQKVWPSDLSHFVWPPDCLRQCRGRDLFRQLWWRGGAPRLRTLARHGRGHAAHSALLSQGPRWV